MILAWLLGCVFDSGEGSRSCTGAQWYECWSDELLIAADSRGAAFQVHADDGWRGTHDITMRTTLANRGSSDCLVAAYVGPVLPDANALPELDPRAGAPEEWAGNVLVGQANLAWARDGDADTLADTGSWDDSPTTGHLRGAVMREAETDAWITIVTCGVVELTGHVRVDLDLFEAPDYPTFYDLSSDIRVTRSF
jgi:hypothetical protein